MVSLALVTCMVGLVSGECLDDAVLKPNEGLLPGKLTNSETLKNLKGLFGNLPEWGDLRSLS